MAHPEQFWIDFQNTFDPLEILVGQRSKDFYSEREDSPVQEILLDLDGSTSSARPLIAFLAGQRGSGKSSMLLRLLEFLQHDYFVVYCDSEHNFESNRAHRIDILLLLGAAIQTAAISEGLDPAPENLIALAQSVHKLTRLTKEASPEEAELIETAKGAISFGASQLGARFTARVNQKSPRYFTLRSGVKEETARKREIEPQVQEIINNINLIVADVETRAGKPLLVVMDGLDKVQEQAYPIFIESQSLREPLCRIIYSAPMSISMQLDFEGLGTGARSYLWPDIKLYPKGEIDHPYEPGYALLREVARKRLQAVGLEIDRFFKQDALDRLIFKSGGVLRWFITLIRDAGKQAERMSSDFVNEQTAQQAINTYAAKLSYRLTREMLYELQEIWLSKRLSSGQITDQLLQLPLVVTYSNPKFWFDVHPMILEEVTEETASSIMN